MPGKKVKDLHIASSLDDLQSKTEIKELSHSGKRLGLSGKHLLESAKECQQNGDEEKTYVLYMKFVEIALHVKKHKKLPTEDYEKYFASSELKNAMVTLEELKKSLRVRYAKQEEKKGRTKPESLAKTKAEENGNAGERTEKDTTNGMSAISISSLELRDLIQEGKVNILVLDTRSEKDFAESHMVLSKLTDGAVDRVTVISVPEEIVKHGLAAVSLSYKLPPESLPAWKKRSAFDLIVLIDWDTYHSSMKPDSSISILNDIMNKWDINTHYKRVPVILDGGYFDWVNTFPMYTTNSHVDLPNKRKSLATAIPNHNIYLAHLLSEGDTFDDLDDVEYPNIIDSPPKSSASNESAPGTMPSLQAAMAARPAVPENRPAPLVDRSSKPTALPASPIKSSPATQSMLRKVINITPDPSNEVLREDTPREVPEEKSVTQVPSSMKERNDLSPVPTHPSMLGVPKDKNEKLDASKGRPFSLSTEETMEKTTSKNVTVPTVDRSLKAKVLQPQGHVGGDGEGSSGSSSFPIPNQEGHKPSIITTPKLVIEDDAKRWDSMEKMEDEMKKIKPFSSDGEEAKKQQKKKIEKDVWITPLKSEPSPGSSSMKRSHSLQNVSRLTDEQECPKFNRCIKPINKTTEIIATRRRTFDGIYGNVGRGLTGLRNLGNSCYMNSILQCINHTTSLVKYFCDGQYREDVNRSTKLRGEVAEEVAALVRALWSGEYRSIACRDLKGVVGMHKKAFAGHEQQDSHEFLTILMDWLHEDLNRAGHRGNKIGSSPSHALAQNASGPEGAMRAWNDFCRLNESLVLHLFYGQQASTVCCLQCGEQSVTYEPFSNLSLPIPPNATRCTLADCMSLYLKGEHISGWNCPKCKEPRDASKKFDIWILPRILVIHFKRFTSDGWCRKRQTMVDFPLEDLDVSQWVGTEVLTSGYNPARKRNSVLYNLYGVSNHYGTMDGGHYTAHCKSSNFNKWFKFDDQEVSELSPGEVVSPAAYILFYSSVDVS